MYLASSLDLASRRYVGWAMRDTLDTELALRALDMAIARRRPAPGLVFHSDRGVQPGFNRSSQQVEVRWIVRRCTMLRQGCASRASCGVGC